MNLADELTQKQALKFQINGIDSKYIIETVSTINKALNSENTEGIFNLNSKVSDADAEILHYTLKKNFPNYNFQYKNDPSINSEIYFRKK